MIENIEWNRDIKNFIRPNCLGLEWVEVNSLTCLHLLSQWHPATSNYLLLQSIAQIFADKLKATFQLPL